MIIIATCGIWKISSNLKQVIDYTTNDEKTEKDNSSIKGLHKEIVDFDNMSNETNNYVSGINCSTKFAFREMQLVKESFNKEDGIIGYHAFQSFKPGEVSPELAHELGVQLAQEMWGDRFQVLVSTHTNTESIHNHFVINSVSFMDGKKCEYSRYSYAELRHLNDSICLEHGLSVLEEKPTRKIIDYANYIKNNNDGKVDYYSLTKLDIDFAIQEAVSYKDFIDLLKGLDYTIYERYGKLSIRANDYKKAIRIERRFGEEYSIDNIKKRISDITKNERKELETYYQKEYHIHPRTKKKYHGLQGLYRYYCYLLKLYPKNIRKYKLTPSMKIESKKLDEISNQAIFLADNNITTKEDLINYKNNVIKELDNMIQNKRRLSYKLKKVDNLTEQENIMISIDKITSKSKTLRKKVKMCEMIEMRSENMESNLKEFESKEEVDRSEPIR